MAAPGFERPFRFEREDATDARRIAKGAGRAHRPFATDVAPGGGDSPASGTRTEHARGSLAAIIGGHVRKLRKRRGLSLEALAGRSGVSRAMLSQIELGRSTPTVAVLCKIAHALEAPLSTFLGEERAESVWPLPAAGAKRLLSGDGRVCLRALFSPDPPRWVEFYELRLKGRGEEVAGPQPPGTIKNLVVSQGEIEIVIAENRYALAAGDAIQFVADVAHVCRNLGQTKAVLYVVTSHARIAS